MQSTLKAANKLHSSTNVDENKEVRREFSSLATSVNKLKFRIKEDGEMRSSDMTSVMESELMRD